MPPRASDCARGDFPGSAKIVLLLPITSGYFGSPPTDLRDVPLRPPLLMFLFAAIEVIGNATVNDLVADFEVVFVCVSSALICHLHLL